MSGSQETHGSHGCVRRVPIFAGLTPEQQSVVGRLARSTTLRRGELLHHAGDPLARLFVVHGGRVKVEHRGESGRRRLLRVAEPGDVVGEHAFFTGAAPDYDAQALDDATMCVFTHRDLERLLGDYPGIALAMLRSMSDQLAEAQRRLALAALDVPDRVADFLLDLPLLPGGPLPGGTVRVRLPWPKRDVAAYLGTTPESFSRALDRLAGRGLIGVQGDTITLLDPEGLERRDGPPG